MSAERESIPIGKVNEAMDWTQNTLNRADDSKQEKIPPLKPRKDFLCEVRKRYASAFTMHALAHVQEGTILEKIVILHKKTRYPILTKNRKIGKNYEFAEP